MQLTLPYPNPPGLSVRAALQHFSNIMISPLISFLSIASHPQVPGINVVAYFYYYYFLLLLLPVIGSQKALVYFFFLDLNYLISE